MITLIHPQIQTIQKITGGNMLLNLRKNIDLREKY